MDNAIMNACYITSDGCLSFVSFPAILDFFRGFAHTEASSANTAHQNITQDKYYFD